MAYHQAQHQASKIAMVEACECVITLGESDAQKNDCKTCILLLPLPVQSVENGAFCDSRVALFNEGEE